MRLASTLEAPSTLASGSRFKPLISTRVPDQAAEFITRLYGPHALRFNESHSFDMEMLGFEVGSLHVGSMRFSTASVAQIQQPRSGWLFSCLRRGTVTHGRSGPVSYPGDAGAAGPQSMGDMRSSIDMIAVNLRVGEREMTEACRALMGVDPGGQLQLAERMPAGSTAALATQRILLNLEMMPAYPQSAAKRFERTVQEAALFELLLAWPNSVSACLEQPAALPRSTRMARDFIHAQLEELPTVADVARHCGVGMRALARGFERHLGVTPLQYLLNLRLDGARQDLRRQREQGQVTEIALRWGFGHQGSFAARYRKRFGEMPSETLRNGRG